MAKPISVLPKDVAKEVAPPDGSPSDTAEPVPTVRFLKAMSPSELVPISGGRSVQFHHPRDNLTGLWSNIGHLDTSDPELISELRRVIVEKPGYYVSEQIES